VLVFVTINLNLESFWSIYKYVNKCCILHKHVRPGRYQKTNYLFFTNQNSAKTAFIVRSLQYWLPGDYMKFNCCPLSLLTTIKFPPGAMRACNGGGTPAEGTGFNCPPDDEGTTC
jgi:hypothetical protein